MTYFKNKESSTYKSLEKIGDVVYETIKNIEVNGVKTKEIKHKDVLEKTIIDAYSFDGFIECLEDEFNNIK